MNKKLIAMATAAALALPMSAVQAEMGHDTAVKASGYVDTVFTLSDDSGQFAPAPTNTKEKKFHTDGEVDVTATQGAVTGRIDVDVTDTNAQFEQAFFSWAANDTFTFNAGRMNTPMGLEAVDVPNINHISHGQIFDLFESNIEGATVDFDLGQASVTAGVLNDVNTPAVDEENSYIIAGSATVMDGLSVAGAFRSADDAVVAGVATSAGNAWDLNATFAQDMFSVSAEIFGTDGITTAAPALPANATGAQFSAYTGALAARADLAWALSGTFAINDMFSVAGRYDNVSYNPAAMEDTTSITLTGAYEAAENLEFLAEWRNDDYGTLDNSSVKLEAIVTLGDFE